MRLASFDIFDTLLTRLVARPRDLFVIAGEELRGVGLILISANEFANARVAAENAAREPFEHRETTFDEIYVELARVLKWSNAQAEAAKAIELAAEKRWLRVSESARRKLETARATADRIYFLSDMYLPRAFLIELLREGKLWREGDELIVSGETKYSKGAGTMYSELRRALGEVSAWRHTGDNERSDIKMAAQNGIETEHFSDCFLTRYEETVLGGGEVSLARSKVAGAMRYARVSAPGGSEDEAVIWRIGATVAAPLLFRYVIWVLEEAARRGVKRLYFISRDGQILLEIARLAIARWKYPVEARYLYGSRQAWRPAAGETLDDWFRGWALGIGTPTNLLSIFSRLEVDPESFEPALAAHGFVKASWAEVLSDERRLALWAVITATEIGEKVMAQRRRKRALAHRYLRLEGLLDDVSIGIVDIGWFATMQRSLAAILVERKTPLVGFYFGILGHPPVEHGGDRVFSFWQDAPGLRSLASTNISLFERFTVATHGSVRGYRAEAGTVVPDLDAYAHQPLLDWGAEHFHASILKGAEALLEVLARGEVDPQELSVWARRSFELFSEEPTREEAVVFGRMPVQDQKNEISAATLVPDLSEWEIFRALVDYRRRPPGWWREGILRAKGSPSMRAYLTARRLRERLSGRS